jgi:hypothetical protein
MSVGPRSVYTGAVLLTVAFSMPATGPFGADVSVAAQSDMQMRLQAMDNFDVDAGPLPQQLDTILSGRQGQSCFLLNLTMVDRRSLRVTRRLSRYGNPSVLGPSSVGSRRWRAGP